MTPVLATALLMMTLLGSAGSLMLKRASVSDTLGALLRNRFFYAGVAGYGAAAAINVWLLRHLDLSLVLPLTSLTYVWTLALARLVLGEQLTARKLLGVGLIIVGVSLIATL